MAIVPGLPLVALFFGVAKWIGTLVQFASTGFLVMSYGMLVKEGAVPNVSVTTAFPYVWMAIFGSWWVGIVWVRRKYQ